MRCEVVKALPFSENCNGLPSRLWLTVVSLLILAQCVTALFEGVSSHPNSIGTTSVVHSH